MIGSRARGRTEAGTVYRLCSLLLEYPEGELFTVREELRQAVAGLHQSEATEALGKFLDWLDSTNPIAAGQHYVETIDLHKRSGLYLTFYAEGDKRERGSALLRLKQMYRAAGLPLGGTELPDYLPVMLEFAADAPDGRGEIVLVEHRAALELIRASLRDHDSPYRHLIDAVCMTLGEPSRRDRASVENLAAAGPPPETVGLEQVAPPEVLPAQEARR